ncbi:MAG: YbdK family carboxylate-amine ligase [Thermodesulfobacteriota bacterium]
MRSINQIEFHRSTPYSIGVELELQLLDQQNLNLTPKAVELLDLVPANLGERIKPEFIRSMVEINTDVCLSLAEVEDNLTAMCREAEKLAARCDCLLYAASLHPFAKSQEQELTPDPRYKRILDDLQLVGRRFITQGLHVHIGLTDGETAIKVCDNIRQYLPVLLALTTSSPFFEGNDSGLHSYRAKLFEALPMAGMPDQLGDWAGFVRIATLLFETEIINEVRDLWWDVRPHPDFGTIEVRICDLPSHFDEILALVALIQALVAWLATDTSATSRNIPTNMQVLRNNKWQASRYGLAGRFVDLDSMGNKPLREAARSLISQVTPFARELGGAPYLAALERILLTGTSTDQQRRIYDAEQSHSAIIAQLRQEFWR